VQAQIGHLDSSVLYATLGTVKMLGETSERIELGVRSVDAKVRLIQKDTGDISTKVQYISSAVRFFKDEFRYLHPRDATPEKARVADGILQQQDGGGRNLESFRHLRVLLCTAEVDALLERRLAELSAVYLPGTCSWIEREESFESFVAQDSEESGT
jgi:hypothetical protein